MSLTEWQQEIKQALGECGLHLSDEIMRQVAAHEALRGEVEVPSTNGDTHRRFVPGDTITHILHGADGQEIIRFDYKIPGYDVNHAIWLRMNEPL